MFFKLTLPFLFLLLTVTHAQIPQGPTCRRKNVFAFAKCDDVCTLVSNEELEKCAQLSQFGCQQRGCGRRGILCPLVGNSPCPDGEIPVTQLTIEPEKPISFNLAVNIRGFPLDVMFLIDGSPSMQPRLRSIKNEIISLFRLIGEDLPSVTGLRPRIAIAVSGGESSFDGKGHRVVQGLTENVDQAISSLDRLPQTVDAPRSTLAALNALTNNGAIRAGLNFRRPNAVFVFVGDKAGREPDCVNRFSRNNVAFGVRDAGAFLLAVNVGSPGIDTALPAVNPCPGDSSSPPIAADQASDLANGARGELINGFNARKIWEAIDKTRRQSPSPVSNVPTSIISIATTIRIIRPFPPPPPPSGCMDKVRVTTGRELGRFTGPTKFDTTVTVALAPGVCNNGPFTCDIQVQEQRIFGRPAPGSIPSIIRDNIKINACPTN